ncbi:MAG: hypothetical protein R3F11_03875 [Verrucomicrobiales bacterium]
MTYALTVTPAALGAAIGILMGDGMRRENRKGAAIALIAIGIGAGMPALIDYVAKAANRPGSQRGSRRRLEGIRQGGVPSDAEFYDDGGDLVKPEVYTAS